MLFVQGVRQVVDLNGVLKEGRYCSGEVALLDQRAKGAAADNWQLARLRRLFLVQVEPVNARVHGKPGK